MLKDGWRRFVAKAAALGVVASVGFTATGIGTAPPAHAGLLDPVTGLLGGTVSTTNDLLGGVVGILAPGWDDNATVAPTRMSQVAAAVGADRMWARGYDGSGVGVAVI